MNKYNVLVYIGQDDQGRQIYEARTAFERQQDAMATLERSSASRYTLESWLTYWIENYAPLRCKSRITVERYKRLAKYLHGPSELLRRLASRPLATLTHIDLEPAIASLVNARGKRRRISARTVRHFANLVGVALKKATKLEHIRSNPMLRVDLPIVAKSRVRSLTPAEIRRLRAVCKGDWTFSFVEVALATGCRRGELLALTWRDINFDRRSVLISTSLEETKEGWRLKGTKSDRPRQCSLPNVAIDALKELRQRQKTGGTYNPRGFVFCNAKGRHLRPDLVSQVVVRRLRKAGIPDASLHTLRHSHASNLLSLGVPLPAVSARLGHCDPQVTAKIYSHALPGDDERAAKVWDELIDQQPEAGERADSEDEE